MRKRGEVGNFLVVEKSMALVELYTGFVELCPLDVGEMEWGVGDGNSLVLDMGCRITVMFPFHESITSLFL
jgi:hypothetical protein